MLGLDPRFSWFTTNAFSGGQTQHSGTALYLLIWNRTRRRVESLDVASGLLVDDCGNQYSSEGAFYWTNDGDGSFNEHGDMLVPNAKLDGFLLYPALRSGASAYVRWYLADTIKIGEKCIEAEYDVELPREPQERALLSAGVTTHPAVSENEDDYLDKNEDDEEDEGELDDDWLYGKK